MLSDMLDDRGYVYAAQLLRTPVRSTRFWAWNAVEWAAWRVQTRAMRGMGGGMMPR